MLPVRLSMVEWYSPALLIKAGIEVIVSTLFGQHADQRAMEALTGPACFYDYSAGELRVRPLDEEDVREDYAPAPTRGMWFDYVADVGDGWNSTYSMAYAITRPKLRISCPRANRAKSTTQHETATDASSFELPQGQLLIFGGDEVYPLASRDEYERRLIAPYASSWNDGQVHPPVDVFAIPGNHDWYDSLRSFSRIFCTSTPFLPRSTPLAQTRTPQNRSYFAIRLPHKWWLLATDVQLGADIDGNQLEYFRRVKKFIKADDRVIFCNAEPHWLPAKRSQKRSPVSSATVLDHLERELLENRVAIFLAGDVHHYMRYTSDEDGSQVHKITSGGGGAFLHPTHRTWGQSFQEPADGDLPGRVFRRRPESVFPPAAVSWLLALQNMAFFFLNPRFGALTGVLYLILAMIMLPAFSRFRQRQEQQEQVHRLERLEKLLSEIKTDLPDTPVLLGAAPTSFSPEGDRRTSREQLALPSGKAVMDFVERTSASAEPAKDSAADASSGATNKSRPTLSPERQVQLKKLANDYAILHDDVEKAAVNPAQATIGYVDRVGKSIRRSGKQPGSSNSEKVPETDDVGTTSANTPVEVPSPSWPWGYLWAIAIQEAGLPDPFQSMLAILIFAGCLAGFIMFTAIPQPVGRFLLGTAHAVVHGLTAYLVTLYSAPLLVWYPTAIMLLLIVLTVGIAAARIVSSTNPEVPLGTRVARSSFAIAPVLLVVILCGEDSRFRSLMVAGMVFAAGWIVGSTILGLYLFLTHSVTGQHWNESFSSLRCENWKHFLRFHLSAEGKLTLYPIGIRRVCRSWKANGEHFQPSNDQEFKPVLIEGPIHIT